MTIAIKDIKKHAITLPGICKSRIFAAPTRPNSGTFERYINKLRKQRTET